MDNAEVAPRAIDAWNRQDLEAFVETWRPDAEWRPAFPEGTEGTGTVFRGHENIERAWRNVREAWAEYRVEADEARMVGDSLLVLGRIYARGATSGIEIDSDRSAVVRLEVVEAEVADGRDCRPPTSCRLQLERQRPAAQLPRDRATLQFEHGVDVRSPVLLAAARTPKHAKTPP